MSGSRTSGPTLAISAGGPSAPAPVTTNSAPYPTSFNAATGAMNNLKSDYVSKPFLASPPIYFAFILESSITNVNQSK